MMIYDLAQYAWQLRNNGSFTGIELKILTWISGKWETSGNIGVYLRWVAPTRKKIGESNIKLLIATSLPLDNYESICYMLEKDWRNTTIESHSFKDWFCTIKISIK